MSGTPNNFSIAIVGGGIGGLVAAISLRQRGHNITVVEQKQQYHDLTGDGGGVTLSWNAVRCLLRLGIEEDLKQIAEETPYYVVRRHSDGSEVSRSSMEKRRIFVYRTDLLLVLHRRAVQLGVHVLFGQSFQSIGEESHHAKLQLDSGDVIEADMIVGADGIKSTVRQCIPANNGIKPELTSYATFLLNVNQQKLEQFSKSSAFQLGLHPFQVWIGPQTEMISWTSSSRKAFHLQMNDFAFGTGERYGAADDSDERFALRFTNMSALRERCKDFDVAIRQLLEAIDSCVVWKVAEMPEGVAWSSTSGRVILLGDAAHAAPPFAGQGACMAIEDATALSAMISHMEPPYSWPAVAQAYTRMRQPRIRFLREVIRQISAMDEVADSSRLAERVKGTKPPSCSPQDGPSQVEAFEDYDAFEEGLKFLGRTNVVR